MSLIKKLFLIMCPLLAGCVLEPVPGTYSTNRTYVVHQWGYKKPAHPDRPGPTRGAIGYYPSPANQSGVVGYQAPSKNSNIGYHANSAPGVGQAVVTSPPSTNNSSIGYQAPATDNAPSSSVGYQAPASAPPAPAVVAAPPPPNEAVVTSPPPAVGYQAPANPPKEEAVVTSPAPSNDSAVGYQAP